MYLISTPPLPRRPLQVIDFTIGLRLSRADELIGADMAEHGIGDQTRSLARDELGERVETLVEGQSSEFRAKIADLFGEFYSATNR